MERGSLKLEGAYTNKKIRAIFFHYRMSYIKDDDEV
jgi:hypothetical protein